MKTALRDSLASFCRSVPYFKGKYRLASALVPLLTNYQVEQECLVTVKMQDGSIIKLDLRSLLEQKVFFTGEYDSDIIHILSKTLHPGVVILDIGANIGLYSIALAEKLKQISNNGQIWAFEPTPTNFQRLSNLVEINNLNNTVYPINTALGNIEGNIQLCLVDEKNNSSTGNAFWLKEGLPNLEKATCTAPITKLDTFVQQNSITKCDLIKVDIEGAEMEFLLGGMSFIQKTRPIIYGEFNPFWVKHFGYSFVDVAKLFMPWEYKFYQQVGRKSFVEITELKEGICDVLMIPQEKLTGIYSQLNTLLR
ncbi:FkbM family methyltransferase [Okeanomitos corallinicola TIOX110]|uniref:FkbM family methyltransferase n=1 Tax=Okeanomitos corallinicola TIOX110 TaxID=3133117 RepID=A0ABZ2UXH4_9CYAN